MQRLFLLPKLELPIRDQVSRCDVVHISVLSSGRVLSFDAEPRSEARCMVPLWLFEVPAAMMPFLLLWGSALESDYFESQVL